MKLLSTIGNLLRHDGRFRFGFTVITIFIILAIVSIFIPHDPRSWNVYPRDLSPSFQNLLGTNSMGQDIFWKATLAIRNSLVLGLVAAAISRGIAIVIGLIAGYRGGILDRVLMTINDSFVIIPTLGEWTLLLLAAALVWRRRRFPG